MHKRGKMALSSLLQFMCFLSCYYMKNQNKNDLLPYEVGYKSKLRLLVNLVLSPAKANFFLAWVCQTFFMGYGMRLGWGYVKTKPNKKVINLFYNQLL